MRSTPRSSSSAVRHTDPSADSAPPCSLLCALCTLRPSAPCTLCTVVLDWLVPPRPRRRAELAKAQKVYRGISNRALSQDLLEPNEYNVRGGVEFAFMSTTADRDVAMDYAKATVKEAASCVMEVKMGMIDRGADLSWLSQYPHEREITFPPYTGLEVLGTRVEGSVLVVELRLNVNLMSPTIEAAVSKMRSAHLQLLDIIHSNMRAANAPQQLLDHTQRSML